MDIQFSVLLIELKRTGKKIESDLNNNKLGRIIKHVQDILGKMCKSFA